MAWPFRGPNFRAARSGQAVIIIYSTAAASSYTPNLTPAYNLTDFDFIDEKGNKDPVQVHRADVFSLPTIQRVEVIARDNQYSAIPVEARDQSQIEVFGSLVGPTIQAHEICDEYVMGPLIAQTILQRELYVRTKFTFKLSWEYCLLDPMDVVTITDPNLGLSNYPVRIVEIEEDDKGLLAFTCEELVQGVSNPALNPSAGTGNFQPNQGVPAVPINSPVIIEPPIALTGGAAQIWIGASGIEAGRFVSVGRRHCLRLCRRCHLFPDLDPDGSGAPGVLDGSVACSRWLGSRRTLAVDLTESGGTLTGTSQAAAQAGATLSIVDQEFVAYEVAALVSNTPRQYNLTGACPRTRRISP